jgi:hypothetical protein
MMVIAMNDVNEFAGSFTFCNMMKSEPVHAIFKQGPEKNSSGKKKKYVEIRIFKCGQRIIEEAYCNRKIQSPDYQRMCFG